MPPGAPHASARRTSRPARDVWGTLGNLLLLGACGALLCLGPVLSVSAAPGPSSGYLYAAAAAGIAFGAVAATLLLITRLVERMAAQRYTVPACVLASFVGMLLWGLAPSWPSLGGDAPLGHLALAFGLLGGGLLALDVARLFGVCLTLLPVASLFGACWAHVGEASPLAAWVVLALNVRLSLGLLACTALLLVALAGHSRAARRARPSSVSELAEVETLARYAPEGVPDAAQANPTSLREAILATKSDWRAWPLPNTNAVLRVPKNFMTRERMRRANAPQRGRPERPKKR